LVKLDAEVAIGQFEPGGLKTLVQPQGKIAEAAVPVSEALTEEAQSSVMVFPVRKKRVLDRACSHCTGIRRILLGTNKEVDHLLAADNYDSSKTYNCSELEEICTMLLA
jgi:hypothetical protein